jgi:hypothetical protein
LAYQATGVIYGDIGTSPLYVYSSTFSSEPSHDDLLGALSLIIWALTIIVTIKYICIVLIANDEGEGGTFAMYNLISRYVSFASFKRVEKTAHSSPKTSRSSEEFWKAFLAYNNFRPPYRLKIPGCLDFFSESSVPLPPHTERQSLSMSRKVTKSI